MKKFILACSMLGMLCSTTHQTRAVTPAVLAPLCHALMACAGTGAVGALMHAIGVIGPDKTIGTGISLAGGAVVGLGAHQLFQFLIDQGCLQWGSNIPLGPETHLAWTIITGTVVAGLIKYNVIKNNFPKKSDELKRLGKYIMAGSSYASLAVGAALATAWYNKL